MSPKSLRVALGLEIKSLRSARWSQEDFADHVGLHRTYLSKVERGIQNLTVVSLARIAAGLELRPSELLRRAERFLENG